MSGPHAKRLRSILRQLKAYAKKHAYTGRPKMKDEDVVHKETMRMIYEEKQKKATRAPRRGLFTYRRST